jgi:hypothetical protein
MNYKSPNTYIMEETKRDSPKKESPKKRKYTRKMKPQPESNVVSDTAVPENPVNV